MAFSFNMSSLRRSDACVRHIGHCHEQTSLVRPVVELVNIYDQALIVEPLTFEVDLVAIHLCVSRRRRPQQLHKLWDRPFARPEFLKGASCDAPRAKLKSLAERLAGRDQREIPVE